MLIFFYGTICFIKVKQILVRLSKVESSILKIKIQFDRGKREKRICPE